MVAPGQGERTAFRNRILRTNLGDMSMNLPTLSLPLAFASLFVAGVALGPGQQATPIDAQPVAGAVHVLYGAGGNVAVSVGPDGVLLVDSQFERQVPGIRAACEGLSDQPLRFVVNTHWHGDHVGGNPLLGSEATILAHANVRERVSHDQVLPRGTSAALPAVGRPVVTFQQGLSIFFNGEQILVRHHPAAHTDGDSTVWFSGSQVLHMGDTFFTGRFPFIDLDSGGSVRGVLAAAQATLEWLPSDARVIPGHGQVCGRAELESYAAFLLECVSLVEEALAEGQSLEDMQAANLFAAYESYSWGLITTERFLETVVRSLQAE